ncbi:hypothetical protein [Streptomyces sp. NPDC017529]|uniref:hypothetical protein n=1 Tax=Streptomyces sp. NPDC017529 TaxID=3365000 RepID=UPI0037AEB676
MAAVVLDIAIDVGHLGVLEGADGGRILPLLAGGPVYPAATYHLRDAQTRRAGTDVAEQLTQAESVGAAETKGSTRCVDDFGFEDFGETRDEPTYVWRPSYRSRDAYLAEVERLGAEWKTRGWQITSLTSHSGCMRRCTGD